MKLFKKKYDYPYIRAWGKLLKSPDFYVEHVVKQAQKEHAPKRAVYKRAVGTWRTLDECNKELQDTIEKIKEEDEGNVRCKALLARRKNSI